MMITLEDETVKFPLTRIFPETVKVAVVTSTLPAISQFPFIHIPPGGAGGGQLEAVVGGMVVATIVVTGGVVVKQLIKQAEFSTTTPVGHSVRRVELKRQFPEVKLTTDAGIAPVIGLLAKFK